MCSTRNAFEDALTCDVEARSNFSFMAPSHQESFVVWILEPEDPTRRLARVAEAIDILACREKRGATTSMASIG